MASSICLIHHLDGSCMYRSDQYHPNQVTNDRMRICDFLPQGEARRVLGLLPRFSSRFDGELSNVTAVDVKLGVTITLQSM
jgi:hypothetical protein